MLISIVLAVVVALAVWLVCVFFGRMFKSVTNVPFLAVAGGFLEEYAIAIGLIAGVLWFFVGGSFLGIHR